MDVRTIHLKFHIVNTIRRRLNNFPCSWCCYYYCHWPDEFRHTSVPSFLLFFLLPFLSVKFLVFICPAIFDRKLFSRTHKHKSLTKQMVRLYIFPCPSIACVAQNISKHQPVVSYRSREATTAASLKHFFFVRF